MLDAAHSSRLIYTLALPMLTALVMAGPAGAQTAELLTDDVALDIDSGLVANVDDPALQPEVIYSTHIAEPDAPWIRLTFGEVMLSGEIEAGNASFIRITSRADDGVQFLNAESIEQWRYTSAYFNGDAVDVELLAYPGTGENRLQITAATIGAGQDQNFIQSICGTTDDRELSNAAPDARLLPVGCTGWLFNEQDHGLLTAGHCVSTNSAFNPDRVQVVEFNVPLSNSNGSINFAHPDDQYPADPDSFIFGRNGCSRDWAYFGAFQNSNTGLTPLQAQGESYQLAEVAPPVDGQSIRIRGYGSVSSPVPPQWNLVQKEHSGPYVYNQGTNIRYQTDTTGGNSGSAVFNEDSGLAIGIHTCAGCNGPSNGNNGTAIHHAGLQWALANPRGINVQDHHCHNSGASCDESSAAPGCEDTACCSTVCSLDPSCCWASWDSVCADLAEMHCAEPLDVNGPLANEPAGHTTRLDMSRRADGQSFGVNWSTGSGHDFRIANRMTIDNPDGWHIDRITVYGYSTGWNSQNVSPIDAATIEIWDGPPDDPNSAVVFGDTTTDRLADSRFAAIYRNSETNNVAVNRAVFANELTVNAELPVGEYWLSVGCTAHPAADSGPWMPPIPDSFQTWGSAMQLTESGWNSRDEDFAFIVHGESINNCPADLTGDGSVGGADLGTLLSEWGDCADPDNCPADLTGDGSVGGADLGTLLSEWGECP